jgi:DNA-directed RNA polymerase specialized sigma24 family protein
LDQAQLLGRWRALSDADGPALPVAGECATSSGQASGFAPELLVIWADPEVRKLAARRAGDPDLAQDALQEAAYAVARGGDLARIHDLKAYFCRVLINKVYSLRGQSATVRPYDPATTAASQSPDETAATRLMARTWLQSFGADRDQLRNSVPGRTRQPARYRDLIVQTAEHILRTAVDGDVSWADCNETLQAALPDWFGQPGSAENTCHKHLSRARRDVQDLLRAIVSRDELRP